MNSVLRERSSSGQDHRGDEQRDMNTMLKGKNACTQDWKMSPEECLIIKHSVGGYTHHRKVPQSPPNFH